MDIKLFPELKTERLLLRALQDSDADAVFRMYSDPLTSEYDAFYPITTLGEARQIIKIGREDYATGKRIQWGIVLLADGGLIGTCSLLNFAEKPKSCETGCSLLPAAWHRGYAVEALRPVLQYAFDRLALAQVLAFAAPENTASHRMLERLCFVRQGTVKERAYYKGQFHDEVEYLNKKM